MDLSHHGLASGGDGTVLARGGESRPSRELDDHGADDFSGSDHHQQCIGVPTSNSSVHDSLSGSHNHTWRDGSHYVPNYTQAPYDFAEFPPQASQPYAQYSDYPYSHPGQVYHQELTCNPYSHETRQVQQQFPVHYFPDHPHNSYDSASETPSSPLDFSAPTPSQISTYSSLSNALDGPIIVRRPSAPSKVVAFKEPTLPTSPMFRPVVPPMGMLPLESSPVLPPSAASTPSSTSLHTPTFSPSTVTAPKTFEVIQDDSAFPSYEKMRKRLQTSSGPSSIESTSPFTTEPLVASTVSVTSTTPTPVRKTAKAPRGTKNKDGSRKKLNLACLFCRERKIACTLPPEGSEEKRCNQCVKRSRVCQMPPGGSRRGQYARRKASKDRADAVADADAASAVDELTLTSPV